MQHVTEPALSGHGSNVKTHKVHRIREAEASQVTARVWFAAGERVHYDPQTRTIRPEGTSANTPDLVRVFRRVARGHADGDAQPWTTFLPGWPDGSFGWARVDRKLPSTHPESRLFVEYVGQGDSDKPTDYPYSSMERADLVEAQWAAEGVKSTVIVGFDYSSIVTLELLSRQLERAARGVASTTRIEGVLLINGGLFVDAHTHPWFTTPVLKSAFGGFVTGLAQRSRFMFGELMKPLWSKGLHGAGR